MPYNPGISYRGDQSIMQGFQGLGRGVEQAGDAMRERKEIEQKGKSSKKAISALQAMGYMEDVDPTALSDRDAIAFLDGGIQAAQYGSQMQQMDYQKLMGKNLEKQMNAPPWSPVSKDLNGDGVPDGYMSSPSSFNLFPQPETPAQLMGPQGPVVQSNGFYGTWDPKAGAYSGWKPLDQGVDLSSMSPENQRFAILMGKGGERNYSDLPTYVPPMPDAREFGPPDPRVMMGVTGNVPQYDASVLMGSPGVVQSPAGKSSGVVPSEGGVPEFETVEQAEAANLKPGTRIIIGGRIAIIE